MQLQTCSQGQLGCILYSKNNPKFAGNLINKESMTIEEIKQFYIRRIQETQTIYSSVKKKIHFTGTLRLVIILLAGITVFYFWNKSTTAVLLTLLFSIIIFLYFVLLHNKLFKKKEYLETSIDSDENELKGISYDYSNFDGAEEKINGEHSFSFDLDIFGNKSLFQALNRTSTLFGKKTLANWLEKPLDNKNNIINRQEAVKELFNKNELRHHFRVTGLLYPGKASDLDEIRKFILMPSILNKNRIWKILPVIMPLFWILIIFLLSTQHLSVSAFSLIFIACLIIGESKIKKINRLQHVAGKKVKIFSSYAHLISIVENENTNAKLLTEIKDSFITGEKRVSIKINRLSKLLGDLDVRFNILARVLLNTVFLWDIRKAIALENWKDENAAVLESWLINLGKYDALCSMATFMHTHPGYIFPEIAENYFIMEGKKLGHPLLNRDICVKNDISIPYDPFFMIVTGANMAGKSTYLRTVGVNYVLACTGFPVNAESLTVFPASLVTSLRTTDSLSDNESYFFAELKRLKMIIDRLKSGEKLFIILDEILKGTNSVDKQKGSLALVQQFISLNSCGIIATHDLLLGSLEKEFPQNIKNTRFEAEIENDELHFSYQLKTGIAQNMNACFLMNKMGITI